MFEIFSGIVRHWRWQVGSCTGKMKSIIVAGRKSTNLSYTMATDNTSTKMAVALVPLFLSAVFSLLVAVPCAASAARQTGGTTLRRILALLEASFG